MFRINRTSCASIIAFFTMLVVVMVGCSMKQKITAASDMAIVQPLKNKTLVWLENEEAAIWQELKTQYKLEKATIEKKVIDTPYTPAHAQALKEKYGTGQELSPAIMALVYEVLDAYGVKRNELIFLEIKKKFPPAGMAYGVLMINPIDFLNYPLNAQKFILAHELTHFIYRDDFMLGLITDEINPTKEQLNDSNHVINRFSRFHELRADISAAMVGPEYAAGLIKFMEIEVAKKPVQAEITHPTYETRLALGESLIKQSYAVA